MFKRLSLARSSAPAARLDLAPTDALCCPRRCQAVGQGISLTRIAPLDSIETTLTLAHGLPNTKYNLEVAGGDTTLIAAIRIYQPPLGRK